MTATLRVWTRIQIRTVEAAQAVRRHGDRLAGDRGEGVISTAIAVLIIAFLGAGMWVGFNTIWDGAEDNIEKQVNNIGGS